MQEIHQLGVVGMSSDRTAVDIYFEESTEVVDDDMESLSGHESMPVVGEVTDEGPCCLNVGTVHGNEYVIIVPLIVPQRSESQNELFGHRENTRRIMYEVGEK